MIELVKGSSVYPVRRVQLGTNITVTEDADGLPVLDAVGGGGGGGATLLDQLTDVNVAGATTGAVLRFSGIEWTAATLTASLVAPGAFPTGTYTFPGVLRLTNDANVDGSNLLVNTATKSLLLYAVEVQRSGTRVASIDVGGLLYGQSLTLGTNTPTTGLIRLPNNTSITARNAANTADILLVGTSGLNNLFVGNLNVNEVQLHASAGQVYRFGVGFYFNSDNISDIGGPSSQRPRIVYAGTALVAGNPSGSEMLRVEGDGRVQGNLRIGGQGFTERHDVGTVGGALTIDWNNGNTQKLRTSSTVTPSFSNPIAGSVYVLEVSYGGAHAIGWPSSVRWTNGVAPSPTGVTDRTDVFVLYYNGTEYLAGVFGLNFTATG